MIVSRRFAANYLILLAALLLTTTILLAESDPDPAPTPAPNIFGSPQQKDRTRPDSPCMPARLDSPFIPVDSWVYPAILRLYALGFVDNVYLGMRPWTRSSVESMLETAGTRIEDADDSPALDQAQEIYESLLHEIDADTQGPCRAHQGKGRVESIYTVARGISGTPLRDSYHLGSTIINDYGRPIREWLL